MASSSKKNVSQPEENLSQLDWIVLRKDMDQVMPTETFTEKLIRKFGENPLVPIGASATIFALVYGIYNFKTGNRQMSQYMMRARVAAQGLTVIAIVGGIFVTAAKVK